MNSSNLDEFNELIQLNLKNRPFNDDELKIKLLKEIARQMLLWASAVEEKDSVSININHQILFDVPFVITGKKLELAKTKDLHLSYYDELFLNAYFNWKENEDEIRSKGYILDNPYIPFIELFKKGGWELRYSYGRLEIHTFFQVIVHPQEDFKTEVPFWTPGDASSALEDTKIAD